MTKTLVFLAMILVLVSCSKKTEGTSVLYEFNSDVSGTYSVEYSSDVDNVSKESFQGSTWSKTVILKPNPNFYNHCLGRLVVDPPTDWANTNKSAHVSARIVANGVEKWKTDTIMKASTSIFELIILD